MDFKLCFLDWKIITLQMDKSKLNLMICPMFESSLIILWTKITMWRIFFQSALPYFSDTVQKGKCIASGRTPLPNSKVHRILILYATKHKKKEETWWQELENEQCVWPRNILPSIPNDCWPRGIRIQYIFNQSICQPPLKVILCLVLPHLCFSILPKLQ